MTTNEIAFLILVIGAFGIFMAVLAYGSHITSSLKKQRDGRG